MADKSEIIGIFVKMPWRYRLKWALKKFWVTKILRRPWKVGWKWYGSYGRIGGPDA